MHQIKKKTAIPYSLLAEHLVCFVARRGVSAYATTPFETWFELGDCLLNRRSAVSFMPTALAKLQQKNDNSKFFIRGYSICYQIVD